MGIEGVVPVELLPPEVRSKYQAKPNEKAKRAKKEETKGGSHETEGNQIGVSNSEAEAEGGRGDAETMERSRGRSNRRRRDRRSWSDGH